MLSVLLLMVVGLRMGGGAVAANPCTNACGTDKQAKASAIAAAAAARVVIVVAVVLPVAPACSGYMY